MQGCIRKRFIKRLVSTRVYETLCSRCREWMSQERRTEDIHTLRGRATSATRGLATLTLPSGRWFNGSQQRREKSIKVSTEYTTATKAACRKIYQESWKIAEANGQRERMAMQSIQDKCKILCTKGSISLIIELHCCPSETRRHKALKRAYELCKPVCGRHIWSMSFELCANKWSGLRVYEVTFNTNTMKNKYSDQGLSFKAYP